MEVLKFFKFDCVGKVPNSPLIPHL